MKYSVVHLIFSDPNDFISDILAAQLGEISFESFVATEKGLDAFVQECKLDEKALNQVIADFPFDADITFTLESVVNKNWNEEWEKYFFEPIVIDDKCVIHSSFHKDFPMLEYDITIDPKMAFGTGHHETTSLMVSEILKMDFTDKTVLDMGCGTSVLAILASMRGAEKLTAIDIDDWCVDNSLDNLKLNNINNIEVFLGDASLLPGKTFDVILANINRNILVNDMHTYAGCLPENGLLFMSGFYTEDIPIIEKEANKYGLTLLGSREKNNWAMIRMVKQ